MPQVQVLEHTPDPTAQAFQQGAQAISDTLLKRQAMEMTKQELLMKKQTAQNELEKQALERKAKAAEMFMKIEEEGGSPEMVAAKIEMLVSAYYGGNKQLFFEDMGTTGERFTHWMEALSTDKGTKRSATAANTARDEQSARMQQLSGDILAGAMPGMGGMGGTGEGMPGAGGGMPGATPQGRQAVGGGMPGASPWKVKDLSTSGDVRFYNPEQELADSINKKRWDLALTTQDRMRGPKAMYEEYGKLLDEAIVQSGGYSPTALGQGVRSLVYKGLAAVGSGEKYGAIAAVNEIRDGVGLSLASVVNGARPSETDFKSALRLVPSISNTKAVNDALVRITNRFMQDPVKLLQEGNIEEYTFLTTMQQASLATDDAKPAWGSREIKGQKYEFYDHAGNPVFRRYVDTVNQDVIEFGREFMAQALKDGKSQEEANAALARILERKGY